jgi:PAS domain S-box-containing protein
LYNDAYTDFLGEKHPSSLGRPFAEVWLEHWADLEPLVNKTLSGEPVYFENAPFTLRRKGADEQSWFSFSYSPVHDIDGQVRGLYCCATETSAQVAAEKARQEETKRISSLVAQAPSFMAVVRGPSHIYELSNDAHGRLVGRNDLIGKTVRKASPVIEVQDHVALLDQVYATGKPFYGSRMPVTFPTNENGLTEQHFVDFIYQPITAPDGVVNGIFIEGSDVTEHVRTEEALRVEKRCAQELSQRLNALLEAAPIGILFTDTQGKVLLANSAHHRMWGAHPTPQSIAEYSGWKGWWADNSERHGRRLKAQEWVISRVLLGEEAPYNTVEIEAGGELGVRRTVLNYGAPVRDADGKLIGAVSVKMDISDRVKAEAALCESEAKFRTITNAMPQMVWSALPSGELDYLNQQFYNYAGASEKAGYRETWIKLIHPDDRERASKRWLHSVQTGESYEIEFRTRHHSGLYRWTLTRALPVRGDQGAIVRWMGTCTDIHEKKLAQEALLEADRQKDEFLAMLAHELRNPLSPITSAAELLATGSLNDEAVQKMSRLIFRQAVHMTGLIDDLLDVSRITQGLVDLEKIPVDLKNVVTQAVEQVQPLLNAKAHHLEVTLPPESARVMGDPLRMVQVLVNILGNAVKYTPQKGRIRLRMTANESQVIVAVCDNGMGMPPELVERVFDLFAQGERTPDRSSGGLGIGLALVKRLISLHGGTVTASSEGLGRGSKFTILLPRLLEE